MSKTSEHESRARTRRALTCAALAAMTWAPGALDAQAGGPPLTPAEREAYQMGLEMAFPCNPTRQAATTGSESALRRGTESLPGTAVVLRSAEGTLFALEEYDAELAGHCMVLGWFGGALAPGTYPIQSLAYRAMEQEVASGRHSFYAMAAVRAPSESSILVVESGTVEITAASREGVEGRVEARGFSLAGAERTDGVVWQGTFRAVRAEP